MFKIGDDEEEPDPIDPSEMPGFQFTHTGTVKALASSVIDLGLLALFNLIFFAGAFISFLRYDLR